MHERTDTALHDPKAPAWAKALDRLARAAWFRNAVLAAIVVAAITVGLETYDAVMARWGGLLRGIDAAILVLFTVEIAVRLGAYGRRPWRFFLDAWNVFDFVIVAVCLIPTAGEAAAVVRLARILRVLRLFTAIPRLQVLVAALLHAIPSIAYVGLLMALIFYIYGVMGTSLFAANDPVHFGNLKLSLLSLFRVITLEDWTDLMYIQMYGSDVYGYAPADVPAGARAMPIVSVLFFVSFVLIGTMITLNLFVGVVLNSMAEAQAERTKTLIDQRARREDPDVAEQIRRVEDELDELRERLRTVREAAGG